MMLGCRGFGIALAVALLSGGCGSGRGDPPDAVSVRDSAGVTILTASEGLDRPLDVVLAPEPDLRIGTIDGGAETQFTSIASAHRLSDGRLLVAESGPQRVRLFSVDGEFLNWIGGVGEGPAEYVAVREAGLLHGDTVWVYDRGRREFELFTPDGDFVRTFRPERPAEAPFLRGLSMLNGGEVLDVGTTFDVQDLPSEPGEIVEDVIASVLDRDGRDAVEVARAPGSHWWATGGRGFTLMYDDRFRSLPLFVGTSEGIVHADPGAFALRALSLSGELIRILRIVSARRAVTPGMIETYEQATLDAYADPARREGVRANMSEYNYADSLPHFEDPLVDAGGDLWLPEYRLPLVRGDADGFYRVWRVALDRGVDGYLPVPGGLAVLSISQGEVLGVERDELDVPYVVAYRLVPRP